MLEEGSRACSLSHPISLSTMQPNQVIHLCTMVKKDFKGSHPPGSKFLAPFLFPPPTVGKTRKEFQAARSGSGTEGPLRATSLLTAPLLHLSATSLAVPQELKHWTGNTSLANTLPSSSRDPLLLPQPGSPQLLLPSFPPLVYRQPPLDLPT